MKGSWGMAKEEWPKTEWPGVTEEGWQGEETRGGHWLTEVWGSTAGAAAFWLGPAMFQSGSSSEARLPWGSESWGSCSKSSGSWWTHALGPWGPATPTHLGAGVPLPAGSTLSFRNSTGGGLQSVGNMSLATCILGFLDNLGVGAEVGLLQRRVGWSPWRRGWSKQLPCRLGNRLGATSASWNPMERTKYCGIPTCPPPSRPLCYAG